MQWSRFWPLALVAILAIALPCGAAPITTLEGTLADSNQIGMGEFTLLVPTWVWIQTWSHGGGTASNSTVVAGGNFDPMVWLFRGSTAGPEGGSATFIGYGDDSTCPPATPGQFGCVDASMGYLPSGQPVLALGPGTYSVAVTEFSKLFLGAEGDPYSAGFNEVDPALYNNAGPDFFVDVQSIPEPATGALAGLGLIAAALLSRRRR